MLEHYLDQLGDMLHLCADTDGILIVNKQGIIEYHSMPIPAYYTHEDTVGKHILDIYPSLTEETSTILTVLRTGIPSYQKVQQLINDRGQNVTLESTTLPIIVDNNVEGVVDSSHFFAIGHRVVRSGPNGELSTLDGIITENASMKKLKRRIWDAAQIDSPVLIYGEIGTGKKLAAEALHREGPRANGPFIVQNCAAMQDTAEAFCGCAGKNLFELANGGTLFLDEVGNLAPETQQMLLRAIQERRYRPIGDRADKSFNVRIIAATNENLEKAVNEKRFRQDLLYRLHDFEITVPPLRDSQEDIMPLAEFFREIANNELECNVIGFDGEARKTLLTHSWPGNVRELRKKIMGAVLQAQTGLVTKEHLELAVTKPNSPVSFALRNDTEDKERILRALKQANGNRKVAAELLGIGRTTLYSKLEEYGLKYKFQQP